MKKLLIIGAGSFSTEIQELSYLLGYNDVAFVDDNEATARCQPVVGSMEDIPVLRAEYGCAIVALGNNEDRMKYHNVLKQYHFDIPTLIHPSAYISPDAQIGCGCIIRANAVVSRYVKLGQSVIINVGGLIDHDCVLEDGCHVLMGAVVRNCVVVPKKTRIESNNVFE